MLINELRKLWRSLFSKKSRPLSRRRPLLEVLEDRLAPATFTWSGNGADNVWSDASNWVGGVAPTGLLNSATKTYADLVFPAGAQQTTLVNDLTNATFNSISISGTGYTLQGNSVILGNPGNYNGGYITAGASGVIQDTISLGIQLGGPNASLQFFTVNTNATLTISSAITGTTGAQLTKTGAGTLVLSGDNSGFTGPLYINSNGGIVEAESNTALGKASSLTNVVTVGPYAQLQVNSTSSSGLTLNNKLVLNGSGIFTDGALLNVAGNNTWSGTVAMDSATYVGSNQGTLTITGQIRDTGAGYNLTKVGVGTIALDAVNIYRGVTSVNNGILEVENAKALGTADGTAATETVVNYNSANQVGGTLLLNDPTGVGFTITNELLDLGSPGFSGSGLDNLNGPNTWAGTIELDHFSATPSIGAEKPGTANTLTITGLIKDKDNNDGLNKNGQGTVIFTHANTYTDSTSVNSGILEVTDSQALGPTGTPGQVLVQSGASLELAVIGNVDSVTKSLRSLDISNTINLAGTGYSNLGALYSHSGVNVITGSLNFTYFFDTIGIGVDSDPNPSATSAYFPTYSTLGIPLTGDYSLTVTGSINGATGQTLDKVGGGQLILPGTYNYPGQTDIKAGWITVGNASTFGTITVETGASLMLKPLLANGNLNPGGSFTLTQTLYLSGTGISHPFSGINKEGALLSLDGNTTAKGYVYLNGIVGIGVQNLDPASFPTASLTLPGEIQDGNSSGGIIKLGTQRLILLDNNAFTNSVEVRQGVLLAQDNTALGSATALSTVTVDAGAALELGGIPVAYDGDITDSNGNLLGLQVWDKNLVLSGSGDPSLGDDSPLVTLVGDNAWRGNVTLATSTDLDVLTGARLSIFGVIDDGGLDATPPSPADLILIGGGELQLYGANTYRGSTYVGTASIAANNSNLDGIIPEIQTLTITGTSGTVTLGYGGHTTSVPYNVTAVSLANALNALSTLQSAGASVSVTQTGTSYTITFLGSLATYSSLTPLLSAVGAGGAKATIASTIPTDFTTNGILTVANSDALGQTVTAQVETVTTSGTTGTFVLTFNGSSTAVPFNLTTTAQTLQNELNALPTISGVGGSVLVSATPGTTSGNVYTITFAGSLAGFNEALIKAVGAGGLKVATAITTPGSGGVIVDNGATLQLQGNITVAEKPLIIQGTGAGAVPSTVPVQWFNLGSSPINGGSSNEAKPTTGRVTGIAINPSNASNIFISTAGGGAWRTEDDGNTWMPFELPADTIVNGTNDLAVSFSGAIAVDPSNTNILYLGTGNTNNSSDSYYGTGLYESTNAGQTWKLVTDSKNNNPLYGTAISSIAVDSNGFVYVATTDQSIGGTGTNAGIWRFNGVSWLNLTSIVSQARTGQKSVLGTPLVPGPDDDFRVSFPQTDASWTGVILANGVLYASLGTAPSALSSGDNSNGVYRCVNYATATAATANAPIWYVGNGNTDSESSTEFPVAQIETLTVTGTTGAFYLSINGQSTGLINTPALTTDVQSALNSLSTITGPENGAVSVTNSTPAGPTLSASLAAGGQLLAGVYYYYVIVANIPAGTTNQSNQVSEQAIGGTTDELAVTLTWTPIAGATSYDIYRTTTPGSYGSSSLVVQQSASSPDTYTDVGAATTTGSPPTPNQDFTIFFEGKATGTITGTGVSGNTTVSSPTITQYQNENVQFTVAGGRVFAATTYQGGQLHEVRQSMDGGQSWFDMPGGAGTQDYDLITPPEQYQGTDGNYSSTIAAYPSYFDTYTIFLGGANGIVETTNDGGSWSYITPDGNKNSPTPFPHTMALDNTNNLIVGGDYGIWGYYNNDWKDLNGNLSITQFNSVAVSPSDLTYATGGTNDNGIVSFTGNPAWAYLAGTNGGNVQIDPTNEENVYVLYDGNLYKSTTGVAGTFTELFVGLSVSVDNFEIDPLDPTHLLVLGRNIFDDQIVVESHDSGQSWKTQPFFSEPAGSAVQSVTPGLLAQASEQGPYQADPAFPDVSAVPSSTYVPGTIYVVTSNQQFFVTKDDGMNWVNRTPTLPANSTIESLIVDPTNSNIVYLVANTRKHGSVTSGSVYESTDAGQVWNAITGTGLPSLPFWTIVLDPRTQILYLGTDNGVWQSAVGSDAWTQLGAGMSNVQVKDLQLNQTLNTLTAATYGRGVFTYYIPDFQMSANSGALRSLSGSAVWTGAIQLAGDTTFSAGGTQALQNGVATATLNIIGSISDGSSDAQFQLTKVGEGNVILSGANSYTGITDVHQGILVVRNPQALGTNSLGGVVESGTALDLESDLDNVSLYLYGNGIMVDGHNTGALHNVTNASDTVTGPIHLMTATVTIGVDSNTTLLLSGVVDDTAMGIGGNANAVGGAILDKELPGELDLSGANTYTGNTNVFQGSLNVQNNTALGAGTTATTNVSDGAQLQLEGGITVTGETLTLSGTGISDTGALENVSGNNTWDGVIKLQLTPAFAPASTPGQTVSIGVVNATDTLTVGGSLGTITEAAPSFNLDETGAGTLVLQNNDSYSGTTTVTSGILNIQSANSLGQLAKGVPAAGITVDPGAELDLQTTAPVSFAAEPLTLSGTGVSGTGALSNVEGNNTWTGAITLADDSSFNVNGATTAVPSQLLITGVISELVPGGGSAALTKNGTGVLDLTQANTYTGGSIVDAGSLEVDGSVGDVLLNGGTLSGTGTVGNVTSSSTNGSTVFPENQITNTPSLLTSSSETWTSNTNFQVDLESPTSYSSLSASGNVNLGSATLTGTAVANLGVIPYWTSFTIIQTTGSATISGEFAQGNIVYLGSQKFYVSYNATSVVLTSIPKYNASLQITSSANPATYGQSFTLTVTATVLGYSVSPPAGLGFTPPPAPAQVTDGSIVTLVFDVNGTPVTVPLSLMSDTATYTPTLPLNTGSYLVNATLDQNQDWNQSPTASLTQVIQAAPTTVSISSTPNPVTVSNGFTVTVTVSAPGISQIPTGTVNLLVTEVGNASFSYTVPARTLNSSGSYQFNLTTGVGGNLPTVGTYMVTSKYGNSDGNFVSGSMPTTPLTEVVENIPTQVTLTSTADPVIYASPFSVNVSVAAPSVTQIPTGNVSLVFTPVGGSGTLLTLTSQPLTNGSATFNVNVTGSSATLLAAGIYTVTSTYTDPTGVFSSSMGTLLTLPVGGNPGGSTLPVIKYATQASISSSMSPSYAGDTVKFTVDMTNLTNPAVVPTGSVTLTAVYSSSLTQTMTMKLSAAGTATFPLTLTLPTGVTSGNYTITATYLPTASFNAPTSANDPPLVQTVFLASAKPDKLVIGTVPTRVILGNSLPSIQVQTLTSNGTVATSYNGPVTLAVHTPVGSTALSGTTTVNAVNGVATFTGLSLGTAATYTLIATTPTLTSAVTAPILVYVPGLATYLTATVINLNQGSFGIQVVARDAVGNVATSYTGMATVSLARSTSGGALVGTLSESFTNGVATISGLRVTKTGTYTFNIASDLLNTSLSQYFFLRVL